ncbi:hypothetical protein D3C78_843550 [compost metagenome]
MTRPGPACSAAATPVITKIPVPIIAPTPSMVRSSAPSVLFNLVAPEFEGAISGFLRNKSILTFSPV